MEDAAAPGLSGLSKSELIDRITELAGHLNAATHRWLLLIAEFDRRHLWTDGALTKSCAHWLSWKCGLDLGAAREKIRLVPVVAFYGPDGRQLAAPIVGALLADFYPTYLERALDQASGALKKP